MANTIATPIGSAVYPKLINPDTKFNADGVYSCKIIVSEEDYNSFRAQIDPLVEQEYNKYLIASGKQKLKRATEPVRINDEGGFEINAKQTAKTTTKQGDVLEFKIALYDADVKPITDEPNIGSGSKMRLSVQPYFWNISALGFGYTLRLKAAQILELVEYSSDSNVFSKEAGGFTQGESFEEVIIEGDSPEEVNF